ncbi:hypothetical protein [Kocuria kalidii]|uniref:hypothetical protein n=1 Tax=Kocuria kalidii TaxID=3376283 RepID=UPI0037A4D53B
MVNFFFDGWEPVARIVLVGTLADTTLVLLLRISGQRTPARRNSFDFVVTVAIGAIFGRVLTARSIPLLEADGSLPVVGPDSAGDGGVLPGEGRP